MTYSRPSAMLLAASMLVGLFSTAGAGVAFAQNPPPQCTGWNDEFHPPTEIRVRISRGPDIGTVAVVPFWDYVGTVLAAEYSTSGPRGPIWMRMGAQSVKQYGWYYAMHWRGGKVTITNEDGTTTTECFDVKDTTADQIYKPVRLVNGEWIPANTPSANNLQAMRETWPNSLRKWVVDKQKSRLFLSGYRSGKGNPCGTDSDGFKVFQKSLADCNLKGLNYEETQRRYYEPRLLIVDPRDHDILDDPDANSQPTYFGDLGVLSPGANSSKTAWRLYAGLDGDAGFAAPVTGSFDIASANIIGQGVGDVNADSRNDLVMLAGGKIRVAVANGTGYADPTSQDLPGGAPSEQMLVGDFNGDLLADVGLLRSTLVAPLPNEPATLVVMRGQANGTLSAPQDWWRGSLDLTTQQVAAGDVNGDGKADLVIRNASAGVTFSVAQSFASCAEPGQYEFTYRGACTFVPGTGLDLATVWLDKPSWNALEVKWTLTDFNRDGRSDLVALIKDGAGIDIFGSAATLDAAFGEAKQLWTSASAPFAEVVPFGLDVNPDGLGDLALLKKYNSNTSVQWLRAVQTQNVVTLSPTNAYNDANVAWAPGTTRPY